MTGDRDERHLDVLRDAVAVVAAPGEVDDLLSAWVDLVGLRFADHVWVDAVDAAEGVRRVAANDRPGAARRTDPPPGEHAGWEAAVHDALASRRQRRLRVHDHGAVVVPVVARDEELGAVTFLSSDTRRWGGRVERLAAEALAATLALPLADLKQRSGAAGGPGGAPSRVVGRQAPLAVGLDVAMSVRDATGTRGAATVWTDVLPLAGNRTALVAGEVGVPGERGRELGRSLQQSVRALAAVDLPPDVLLRHLSDLVRGLEPGVVVTCVYAVHDAAAGCVAVANAGHAPPLVVVPDADDRYRTLGQAIGAPLGLGARGVRADDVQLTKGAVLVLAAGTLVEGDRLSVLGEQAAAAAADEELSRTAVELVGRAPGSGGPAGLLLARATDSGVQHVELDLPDGPEAGRVARVAVRELCDAWSLADDLETVELLVSELVTNAVVHARGPYALRLQLRERVLVCEVSDGSVRAPVPRVVGWDAESGRGLELTSQLAARWGYRQLAAGKVVWCELDLVR